MKRASVLKIVNPILGVLLINQVVTGLLNDVLSKEVYEVIHEGAGIVLAIVALLHVVLNWSWVKANFFRKLPTHKAQPVSGQPS